MKDDLRQNDGTTGEKGSGCSSRVQDSPRSVVSPGKEGNILFLICVKKTTASKRLQRLQLWIFSQLLALYCSEILIAYKSYPVSRTSSLRGSVICLVCAMLNKIIELQTRHLIVIRIRLEVWNGIQQIPRLKLSSFGFTQAVQRI